MADQRARDLRAALREADWEALLPRVVDYTERRLRRLRWVVGRDEEPSAVSVQEMINEAVDRCLTGVRTWNTVDPPELGAFLCGVIKSITSAAKKKQVRSMVDSIEKVGVDARDPTPSIQEALEEEGTRAICATVEACLKGDEKLELLYLAILDDNLKREAIAEALGWTVDEVTATRNKLQRRLVSQFPAEFRVVQEDEGEVMSDPKAKKDIEALVEALDDVPLDEADARVAVQRLGIDVKNWAGAIRQRVAAADESDRAVRFDEARRAYADDAARYDSKEREPKRSIEEQRATMRALVARIPRESTAAAVHFHKFEEATEEELAEMIKALRHLLKEDE